jgi:uncharacterized protein YkwD
MVETSQSALMLMLLCRKRISHDRAQERCQAAGLGPCRENVAMNMGKDPVDGCQKAMKQWEESSGHYENIMADDVDRLGASYAECNGEMYFTQMFGTKLDSKYYG